MARADDLAVLHLGSLERLTIVGTAVFDGVQLGTAADDDDVLPLQLNGERRSLVDGVGGTHVDPTHTDAAPVRSEHPGLQPRRFGHHALVPGRVEGQGHACFAHGRNASDLVAHVVHQDIPHAAAGRRERDGDVHRPCAVLVLGDRAIVDQPQIDDVDGYLRIVAGAHLLPGEMLYVIFAGVRRQLGRLDRLLADSVGVLAGDAKQVPFEIHREAAAERLCYVAGLARLELHLLARGNDDRAHLTAHHERLVLVSAHGRYSVDTVAAVSEASAAFKVCQQRLAHLTRAGNSRTPESAASLPSEASGAPSGCVRRACTLSKSCRAPARSLPLTASVMREAEAVEMAQPRPSKRISSMLSPSNRTARMSRSPH